MYLLTMQRSAGVYLLSFFQYKKLPPYTSKDGNLQVASIRLLIFKLLIKGTIGVKYSIDAIIYEF